jgi:FkbM family methyltransferase
MDRALTDSRVTPTGVPFNLYRIVEIPAHDIYIVDVGAASMGAGTDPYHALTVFPHCHVQGFEPNQTACEELNKKAAPNRKYLPYFVADGTARQFYECANPLTSSLYQPNAALLDRFQRMALPVLNSTTVQTVTLDDIDKIGDCDYLKLDIQGAELDAINGADNLLSNALVVHTEVEFIPMYCGQPLFGDIDLALRKRGFLLHNFVGLFTRQMKPLVFNNDPFSSFSQLLFAEGAIYVRDFMLFDSLPSNKLINLAAIMHFVYRSYDLTAHAFDFHDKKFGTNYLQKYVQHLSGQLPVNAGL